MEKSYKLHFITALVDHYIIVGLIVGVGEPLIVDTPIKYIELALFDKHTLNFIF